MMTYADPDDFPDYSDVDSRTVLDPEDSFDEKAADFTAEPAIHDSEDED